MKKIILFSVVACSVAFYACKKDDKDTTTTPPDTQIPADTLNPSALSAGTTVGSAISAKGDIPATSSGAPVLEVDGYDNRTYYAVSGRYIVIYPKSASGFIAGYYVKINGADSYFKVNYAKAAAERKAARKTNKHYGNLREEGDNADSSIVIKLPADITGDTFSIKYAAYDSLNRVSNTLTAIVNLLRTDSASSSAISGRWFFNRQKRNNNDWTSWAETDSSSITCNEPQGRVYECYDNSCHKVLSYYRGDSSFYEFDAKQKVTYTSYEIYRYLNWEASSCDALVYSSKGDDNARTQAAGYSYNAATKTFTFIIDGDGSRDPYSYATNLYTQQLKVKELTATKLVMYQTQYYNEGRDYIDTYYEEYLKK